MPRALILKPALQPERATQRRTPSAARIDDARATMGPILRSSSATTAACAWRGASLRARSHAVVPPSWRRAGRDPSRIEGAVTPQPALTPAAFACTSTRGSARRRRTAEAAPQRAAQCSGVQPPYRRERRLQTGGPARPPSFSPHPALCARVHARIGKYTVGGTPRTRGLPVPRDAARSCQTARVTTAWIRGGHRALTRLALRFCHPQQVRS